jgi:hypothetical protein
MKNLLGYFLICLLTSCATIKPLPQHSAAEQDAQSQSYGQPQPTRPDSTSGPRIEPGSQADFIRSIFEGHPPVVQQDIPSDVVAAPDSLPFVKVPKKTSLFRRLFPAKQQSVSDTHVGNMPRKCKGCTINVVAGDQHNSTTGKKATSATGAGAVATVIEKKAGPAIVASDSSTSNAILGGGNIQATTGNNNTPQLTAPVQQAADWKATLAKPAGYVFAIGLVCLIIFLLIKRRNSLSNNA